MEVNDKLRGLFLSESLISVMYRVFQKALYNFESV
jgi:hypothetical protein